ARRGRGGLRRDRRHHRVLPDRAQHGGRRAEPRPAPDRGGPQLRCAGRRSLPQDHPAGLLARPHHRHRRRVHRRQERARSSRVSLLADAAHRGDVRRLRAHRTDRSRAHPRAAPAAARAGLDTAGKGAHMRMPRAIVVASLVVLAAAPAAWAQAKPTVKIGYIPTDSFAALFLLADRHLPAAGINVETVRLAGGSEIVSQVATGQLQLGGAGMGAAGFNAVVSGLPVEYIAPLHSGYVEDYFVVRKAVWGKEVKRIADLKGRAVALNVRGAAVEWI